MPTSLFKKQIIPIGVTILIGFVLTGLLAAEVLIINRFIERDIILHIRWLDVLIGLTVYLKTSIDFAIYIGHLMDSNPGWKSRVAISLGTSAGNAIGTLVVLLIWAIFKEVKWLMALMILVASLVLFKLAEESLDHAREEDKAYPRWFKRIVLVLDWKLKKINKMIMPILKYVVPNLKFKSKENKLPFWQLVAFSFTIPFILGLDDFAGYVPLFDVINVLGFGIGVFLGHMILTILLYISPQRTTHTVKNPVISLMGSLAFIGLGFWGLFEVVQIIG